MPTHLMPLTQLVERPADAVLFRGPAGVVTAAAFLHDAHALARKLPDGAFLVNLCRDRYAFTVAFAAALLRRQVCLLPGDASPARLAALAQQYPGCTAVMDAPDPSVPMPGCLVRPTRTRDAAGVDNPVLPSRQLAAIVFTSGSTGTPVAHPKLWGALAERSRAAAGAFGLDAAPPAVVGTVPPGHMYGFETTALLPLHAPAASWCGPAFYPGDIAAALAAVPAPRILVTTPLQLRALVGSGAALPPLQAVISATAPLDPALAGEAERRWNAPVMEIFGATEVGSIASRRTTAGDRWTAYPGVDIQAGADGTTVGAPWAGPTPLADDLEMEGAGRFRLLGRRADLVKLGGRRASLSGLNRILLELDGVADGAFVVPDDLGQRANARLLAVVVAPRRSAEGILADLRGRMDPLFLPRRVVRVDALPRNELGKLPRQALLAMLQPYAQAMTPAGRFRIPADHPSLPGHFPGRPVVPGVVLLDLILDAAACACAGWRVTGLPAVKFLRPVLPGQEVVILLQAAAERVGMSCTVDGQEVLRGTLALAAMATTTGTSAATATGPA